jgi:hypothetical protein
VLDGNAVSDENRQARVCGKALEGFLQGVNAARPPRVLDKKSELLIRDSAREELALSRCDMVCERQSRSSHLRMPVRIALMEQQIRATGHVTIDVMVSYSSKNRTEVMRWVHRLRSAGVAVWIDQGGIDGAQRWGEEIVNAIDSCKTVLLMISRTSMESENIMKEVSLAWESGKKFLPLRLEEAKIPKSMQYQLAGIQHINL